MSYFSGLCIGGPCDGDMLTNKEPRFRVQVSLPMANLYDERVYMHNQPIGPTSVDYEHVPGIRLPDGIKMDFFLLTTQIRDCREKGMSPVAWAFNHMVRDYCNTRVDTI